jgi:hypothetical protein
VTEGVALNITLVTYDQNVDFGIIACRRTMPQVQRLIDYMEQSLCELEEAAGLAGGGARRNAKGKSIGKSKVKSRVKAQKKGTGKVQRKRAS